MAQSHFEKMGQNPLVGTVVNTSGNRSPYTQLRPKKGPSGDSESEPASVRGRTMIHEAHGPTFRPVTTISYPNAPEHAATGRGMRTVPSSLGNRDFWSARSVQGGEVIS